MTTTEYTLEPNETLDTETLQPLTPSDPHYPPDRGFRFVGACGECTLCCCGSGKDYTQTVTVLGEPYRGHDSDGDARLFRAVRIASGCYTTPSEGVVWYDGYEWHYEKK